jgi:hypothetical protein
MSTNRIARFDMENSLPISISTLEAELRSYYAALAFAVDECFEHGAGARMLGCEESASGSFYERVDLSRSRLGAHLPLWYRYAYECELSAGYSPARIQEIDGPFERLTDLVEIFASQQHAYLQDVHEYCGAIDPPKGHLDNMIQRVRARANMDGGYPLSVAEIAVLADMNERSVRNATSAEGDARLVLQHDGTVANVEANRWLSGRRGFIPTKFRGFSKRQLPADLLDVEIPEFVTERLFARFTEADALEGSGKSWRQLAAEDAGLAEERIDAATSLPLSIRPQECAGLARAMQIDLNWFTLQVMSALFPDQVDMLINPNHWDQEAPATAPPATEALGAVTVTLTPAMLKNGYIDIPMSAKLLFPSDSLGARSTGDEGAPIEIVFGAHREMSDIRMKSQRTLSPRKRFYAWLNTELGAKPGDRIRIERTGERQFTMHHVAT